MADVDLLNRDFASRDPDLFARILIDGDVDECILAIESLPADRKAAIVARLPTVRVRQLLGSGQLKPTDWLVDASFDDAVTLLSRFSRERRIALVNALKDPDRQRQLLRSQQYPPHSVGALVEDIPLRVSKESQAPVVLAALRDLDLEAQAPAVVLNTEGHYVGVLDGWQLLLDNPTTGPVTDYVVAARAVRPEAPSTGIVDSDQWAARNWMPVVDHRRRALGVVKRERVLHAVSTQSGNAAHRQDILLDLLDDLVKFCETVLFKSVVRKGST